MFGSSAQISTAPGLGSSVIDATTNAYLTVARQSIGDGFTPQCENVATFVQCIQAGRPCMDRVWCSDLSVNDIQQRISESCQCSGNAPNCGSFVSSLRGLAGSFTNYHMTGQAPSGSTCQAATLGEAFDHRPKLLSLFHSFPQAFQFTVQCQNSIHACT